MLLHQPWNERAKPSESPEKMFSKNFQFIDFSRVLKWLITPTHLSHLLVSCSEFIVLSSPKSVEFKGNSDLPSESLSEVLSATLGYSIQSSNVWDGLYVNDPFNTAKSVVSIVVEGADDLKFKVTIGLRQKITQFLINLVILERESIQPCRR